MFDKRRMNRVFRADGRTLIVAMDHLGFMDEPIPALQSPEEVAVTCLEAGADAVMVNRGSARAVSSVIGPGGLILSVNVGGSELIERIVEQALVLGADALKVLAFPFRASGDTAMDAVTSLGAVCDRWAMPFLVETIPGGWEGGAAMREAGKVAAAARVGAEAGGDFIKTFMTDGPGEFETVVRDARVPVVILGGAAGGDDKSLFETVRSALDQGAAGVAIGRNIWGHARPELMVTALSALIHDDATVEEALETIGG